VKEGAKRSSKATPRVPLQTPMFDQNGQLTRTWIIFFERLGLEKIETVEEAPPTALDRKATFGIVKDLEVADRLTLYYIVRKEGTFVDCVAKIADVAPTGSSAILDIQRSTDDGVTWASIFPPGNLLTLPAGSTDTVFKSAFNETVTGVEVADLLRIGCTQIGSVTAGKGIEVVLQWE
jgi:hypothetical protein